MTNVTALMAGTVNEIKVNVGDIVEAGQEVVVLESMKMLIPLQTPTGGKVTKIMAGVGQFVNQGETLVVLD